ncbi:hypothetical protein SPRG_21983 [Saprolegnia parasitica CBS 223.65]|uniref:Uncharacterized protein n=1 Tax=Saprolegnia parasitica (strain CBS 223.65) TaxID=695850 RepID=A0A067BEH3_SAPPC|nr:hypothetical protein SPRG_21983 [Saprolegnia parasitica CBS 223.65]KDO16533.1 hypothetical protein SPRG_21983 [Saprolegnia parasitica CBS 223.65]|eukprot:XP_012212758.1 hypothetical protein SPRG_21983 [Saprolegnia parasitica CBS 223.65]
MPSTNPRWKTAVLLCLPSCRQMSRGVSHQCVTTIQQSRCWLPTQHPMRAMCLQLPFHVCPWTISAARMRSMTVHGPTKPTRPSAWQPQQLLFPARVAVTTETTTCTKKRLTIRRAPQMTEHLRRSTPKCRRTLRRHR